MSLIMHGSCIEFVISSNLKGRLFFLMLLNSQEITASQVENCPTLRFEINAAADSGRGGGGERCQK